MDNRIVVAGNSVSSDYLFALTGDPRYAGIAMDITQVHGIDVRGFWSKAWKVARGDSGLVQDCFQEIILGAIEEVQRNPEITEKSPGYLLTKATWRAENRRTSGANINARQGQTFGIQELSIDTEAMEEKVGTPIVDQDLIIAVREVVSKMRDDLMREIALMFMEGYTKSAIADVLGICPGTVTYQVKKLKKVLGALVAA
jgi:DNA-directed RNA polymerase specialized sigma24 family protein